MPYPTRTLGDLFRSGLIERFKIAEDGEAIHRLRPDGIERVDLPAMEEGSGEVWVEHQHCNRRDGNERYFNPELEIKIIPPNNWVDAGGAPDEED